MDYKQIYNLGKQAKKNGITTMRDFVNAYWSQAKYFDHTEMVFAEAGLSNAEMPYEVTGWRYGKLPTSGRSYNARDGYAESGVSVMAIDGGGETQDMVSAAFIAAGRPVVRVRGLLNTIRRGADGEPLLLNAKEIK